MVRRMHVNGNAARVAVGYIPGELRFWQSMILDALGPGVGVAAPLAAWEDGVRAGGVRARPLAAAAVSLPHPARGPARAGHEGLCAVARESLLPQPWRGLYALERRGRGPALLPLDRICLPQPTAEGAPAPDMLVLPPGCRLCGKDLEALPLGCLEFEPLHPQRFFPVQGVRASCLDPALASPGTLSGRMFWRRAGSAPRLAAQVFTCVQGPMPLSWVSAHWAKLAAQPAGLLARMALEGEQAWLDCPEAGPLPPYVPGAGFLSGFAARFCGHWLGRAWRDILHRRQWYLAVRAGDGDPMRPTFASEPFDPVFPPGRTGFADPFFFSHKGREWLFVEEIPCGEKGVLSVLERLPQGGFGPARRVLEEPFHLSYPNVFEHGGELYMLPETAGANQVRLYRAAEFPWRWELDRVLVDGVSATDATLAHHGGRWWLFVTQRRPGGCSWDEMHLYMGSTCFGPFSPHPLNPVVADVRRARPAGRVFSRSGRFYRPAQDCSGWYGRGLRILEITRLDETGFEEREAASLTADLVPGSFCLHAFDAQGGVEIVDAQRFVPLWR